VIVTIALALLTPRPSQEEPVATKRRTSRIKRRAATAAGVITALAIAAPVAGASAATPRDFGLGALPAFPALPGYTPAPLGFVGPSVGFVAVAIGPTVIGSVFNGGTTVVVSTSPAAGSVIGSP
jgi:hypothetical protein